MFIVKDGLRADTASAVWRTSSRSGNNGACVQVAVLPGVADPDDPVDEDSGSASDEE
jgi:hypothetical protein